MKKLDRLSALMGRFDLTVAATAPAEANLVIFAGAATDEPTRLIFTPRDYVTAAPAAGEKLTFSAFASWGGGTNPFLTALPRIVETPIESGSELVHIAKLLQIEGAAPRCGASAMLDRLGGVLLIRVLRWQMERGTTDVSLLSGLADARLSRAIVAMHDEPGRIWRGEDLAALAGLSLSRFAELFKAKVGETPAAYLRRWRLVLARQDAERGDRIQTIARRYGYGSPEALSRAFRKEFDISAISLRRA